jgi:hypothetical protein
LKRKTMPKERYHLGLAWNLNRGRKDAA